MAADIRSRNRVLYILQLFQARPVWTVDEIAKEMGISASSAYRDVQELTVAGFLDSAHGAGYALGPAFIEYDRLTRSGDPLIRFAAPVMRDLLEATTQRASAVLCRRYRACVMCVHQEHGSAPHPASSYERGMAMPLFKGATAKAILAHLDERILRRLYLEHEAEIREASGAASWKAFREELADIRTAGYAITVSEVAADRVGVAAPVHSDGKVVAALSLVLHSKDFKGGARETWPRAVKAAAARVSRTLATEKTWVARV